MNLTAVFTLEMCLRTFLSSFVWNRSGKGSSLLERERTVSEGGGLSPPVGKGEGCALSRREGGRVQPPPSEALHEQFNRHRRQVPHVRSLDGSLC